MKNNKQFEMWFVLWSEKEDWIIDFKDFEELMPWAVKWGVYLKYFGTVEMITITDFDVNLKKWFAWIMNPALNFRVKLLSDFQENNTMYFETEEDAQRELVKTVNKLLTKKK